jgi:hypothetical protein
MERVESRDATRYFLVSHPTNAIQPRLPPLGTGVWLRDEIFFTFWKRSEPPCKRKVAPEALRSHLFWRKIIQKNSARLPLERLNNLERNKSAYLLNLPTELVEMVENHLGLVERISLRLTSRTLFVRLAAPRIHHNTNIHRLKRIQRNFNLTKLIRMEQNNSITIHRSGQGCYKEIVMRVCSSCAVCHQEHHFSSEERQKPPLTRTCLSAEPKPRRPTRGFDQCFSLASPQHVPRL